MNEENCKKIRDLLEKISKCGPNNSPYFEDKKIISKIFDITQKNGLDLQAVRIRLTLLDSMYSTQMRMRPYGLEHLTTEIFEKCYQNNAAGLKNTLNAIIVGEEKASSDEADNIYNLFDSKYGVKTNNAQAVSLISKYFYFDTDFKFPIYDSIVREYLPILHEYCGASLNPISANNIKQYIKIIKDFFGQIDYTCDESRYDSLDHLLWVVGKIIRGNLSLVLNKEQYEIIIKEENYNFFEKRIKSKNNINDVYENYIKTLKKVAGKEGFLSDFADIASDFIKIKLSKNKRSKPEINGN